MHVYSHITSVKSFRNFHSNVIYARLLWVTVMTDDDFAPREKVFNRLGEIKLKYRRKVHKKIIISRGQVG